MTVVICRSNERFLRLLEITGVPGAKADFVPLDQLARVTDYAADRPILIFAEPQVCRSTKSHLAELGLSEERLISAEEPARVFSALRDTASRDDSEMVKLLIREDYFERAYYAYPLMTAAAQAKALGLRGFRAIELGVWTGIGLLNLGSLASVIGDVHDLEIEVVGFDTGAGMPDPIGWPDHPELWQTGQLLMPDFNELRTRLPDNTKLVIGNVADTIVDFSKSLSKELPLGFVALDVDYFSSSEAALKVFDLEDQTHYLPATPVYVDDSYIGVTQHEFSGEALAIHLRNLPNIRAIEEGRFDDASQLILRKHVRPGKPGKAWHHCMYFAHMLRHPVRKGDETTKLSGIHHVHF
ncbi:MAG: hypothetical protein AAGA28_11660 [Pseudomonadota bacterium]